VAHARLGRSRVPERAEGFRAHVSLAYSSAAGPAAPIAAALDQVQSEPVTVTVREAALIILNRDQRMYQWQTCTTAPLGRS
jgi:hypothetical protein